MDVTIGGRYTINAILLVIGNGRYKAGLLHRDLHLLLKVHVSVIELDPVGVAFEAENFLLPAEDCALDTVYMVALVYGRIGAELELLILFGHMLIYLLLNCLIGLIVTLNDRRLHGIDNVLHELTPVHLPITIDIHLRE
jgi:hypothetical protein